MKNWQALKAYIGNAFEEEKIEIMLQGAGKTYYSKAGNANWDGTKQLISAVNSFIAQYTKELSLNNNMPISFPAQFQSDGAACADLATAFANADMNKELTVKTKLDANNLCYTTVVRLLNDGNRCLKVSLQFKDNFQ
jgi:hypothetical protein